LGASAESSVAFLDQWLLLGQPLGSHDRHIPISMPPSITLDR
jgi:hypothetical protein